MTEGILLEIGGKYVEAEGFYRRGLIGIDRAIADDTDSPPKLLYSLADVLVLYKAELHGRLATTLTGPIRSDISMFSVDSSKLTASSGTFSARSTR